MNLLRPTKIACLTPQKVSLFPKFVLVCLVLFSTSIARAESLCLMRLAQVTDSADAQSGRPSLKVLGASVTEVLKEGLPVRDRSAAISRLRFSIEQMFKDTGYGDALQESAVVSLEGFLHNLSIVEIYGLEKFFNLVNKNKNLFQEPGFEELLRSSQKIVNALYPKGRLNVPPETFVKGSTLVGIACTLVVSIPQIVFDTANSPFDAVFNSFTLGATIICAVGTGVSLQKLALKKAPKRVSFDFLNLWKSLYLFNTKLNALSDLELTRSIISRLYAEYKLSEVTIGRLNEQSATLNAFYISVFFSSEATFVKDVFAVWRLYDFDDSALWTILKGYFETPTLKLLNAEVKDKLYKHFEEVIQSMAREEALRNRVSN